MNSTIKKFTLILVAGLLYFTFLSFRIPDFTSDKEIVTSFNWDDQEITVYKEKGVSYYTNGDKTCDTKLHTMNSKDGSQRLFLITYNAAVSYEFYQNGERVDPIHSYVSSEDFDVSGLDTEEKELAYQIALDYASFLLGKEITTFEILADFYSFDTSSKIHVRNPEITKPITMRFENLASSNQRHYVDFSLDELNEFISDWTETSVYTGRINHGRFHTQVIWLDTTNRTLILENGLTLHTPMVEVTKIILNDQEMMRVIQQHEYNHATTTYYELTEDQWKEFTDWKDSLKLE